MLTSEEFIVVVTCPFEVENKMSIIDTGSLNQTTFVLDMSKNTTSKLAISDSQTHCFYGNVNDEATGILSDGNFKSILISGS